MAAEVIIELIPNTSKVESALDQIGNEDGSADVFRQGNEELKKRKALQDQNNKALNIEAATLKDLRQNIQNVTKTAIDLGSSLMDGIEHGIVEELKAAGVTLDQFEDALKQNGSSLEAYKQLIKQVIEEEMKAQGATESLRQEKKRLQAQIAQLILAGEQESEMYLELVSRAGEIDDAMKDAADTISRTGSDTRALDNVITAAQGITAGFTIATSAAALFGDESDDTQKILLKVNAAMSLLNGLQEIQNILRSEDNKTLLVKITRQITSNAQAAIETGLQSKSAVARVAATVAQWGLNAAMNANPIGLIITGLTALIGIMYAYANSANDTAAAQAALNAQLKSSEDGIEAELQAFDRSTKLKVAQLQLREAKQSEVDQLELSNMRAKAEAYSRELNSIDKVLAATKKSDADQLDLMKKRHEIQTALDDLNNEGQVKQIEIQKQVRDENKKTAEESVKLAKEAREKALETLQNQVNDRKALAQLSLLYANQGSEEELQARINIMKAEMDSQLASDKLTANQRKLIIAQTEREIADLKKQFAFNAMRDEKEIELLKAQNRLAGFIEGSREYDEARKSELRRQAELDVIDIQQSVANEAIKAQKILLINVNLNKSIDLITQTRFEDEQRAYEDHLRLMDELAVRNLQNRANDPRLNERQRYKAELAVLQLQLQQYYRMRDEMHLRALKDHSYADKEYSNELVDNTIKTEEKRNEIKNKSNDLDDIHRQEMIAITNASFSVLQEASDAWYSSEKARADAKLEEELSNLDARKEKELENENLTAAQKKAIDQKYAAEEKRIRKAAAEDEKRRKIQQAIANGFLAVTNILATMPWSDFGIAHGIAIGSAVAKTALEVASISRTPTGYEKGTGNATRGWHWVGEKGPELLWFNGGEKVKPHHESIREYNEMIASSIPQITDFSTYSASTVVDIDYELLGSTIAKHVTKSMKNLPAPTTVVNVDGIKEIIFKQNSKTEYLNKRKRFD